MNTEDVKIVELNAENWYDCCKLEVSTEQKEYIESNAISIAQSKFELTLKPYAINTVSYTHLTLPTKSLV